MLTNSSYAQEDTIRLPIDKFKYIQAWAEYGLTCDSIVVKLTEQIEKDANRTVEMAKEIDKANRRKKWLGIGCATLGAAVLTETIILILKP